jgi:hypothetical protein
VHLARADSQNDALRVYDELRNAGYPAEIFPTMDGDKRAYVVRIRSLPSRAEAQRSPTGCAAGSASTIRRFRAEAAYIIAALCRCTSNTSIRNSSPPSRCPMSTR